MPDQNVIHRRLVVLERIFRRLAGDHRQLRGEVESLREQAGVAQQPIGVWAVHGGIQPVPGP